ncbi:C6 transcription factor [Talaromyces pinophilus]|uniref:C6 transcription factor n=1 Tax=Talaromyces pinophilus TaxID=128442 RepID=A0A6N4SLX9_TALPI|nr:C6 transcription factor [Talaromyces pinophilus]
MSHQPQLQSQNQSRSQSGRLSAMVILAHMNVYLKYLYPIIPVVNSEQILNDSQQPEQLTPQRYAFITALCAATHVQLQLDAMIDPSSSSAYYDSSLALSGIEILTEATNARNECNDICEQVTLESLLTSFFLFAAYGNLDRQDQAWFYLSQATSMALTLGLHREATYSAFGEEEAEERRRVFWLLFVTERAYALQQAKPIMLRNSIRKPAILSTEDHIIQYGFYNLISIFEKITAELYDWIAIECDETFVASMTAGRTNMRDISRRHHFSKPIPIGSVAEIQNLDIAGTQQWLQAMAWKLSMSDLSQFRSTDALLPFHFPVLVAKAVMDVFQGSTVLQSIGRYERRFSNIKSEPGMQDYPTHDINNEEFLLDIMNILSRIRPNKNHQHQSYQFFLSQTSPSSTSPSNQFFPQ